MEQVDLLLRVRQATRSQHEGLEAQLPFTETLDQQFYQERLVLFLGLFEPLEQALAELSLPPELESAKRHRSHLLVQDLVAIGVAHEIIERLPRCKEIPALRGTASALGCMYVLEGSTLGGQVISKIVYERLGLAERSGCSFFHSYGPDVGNMWRKFCDIVREHVVTPEAQQDFIAAAQSTFATFHAWLEAKNARFARERKVSTLLGS